MFQTEGHYYALGEHYNSVVPAWAGEREEKWTEEKINAEVKWCALGEGGERLERMLHKWRNIHHVV